jgi:DNA-binding XRE family transcriptional regulator
LKCDFWHLLCANFPPVDQNTTFFVVHNTPLPRHDATVSDELYLAVVRMRIREARKATSLKQEEVAEKVELTHRHYQRYEAANYPGFAMSLLTLRKIAKVLNREMSDLVKEPSAKELERLKE